MVLTTYNEPFPGLVRSEGEAAIKVASPLVLAQPLPLHSDVPDRIDLLILRIQRIVVFEGWDRCRVRLQLHTVRAFRYDASIDLALNQQGEGQMPTNIHQFRSSKSTRFIGVALGLLIALTGSPAIAAETSETATEGAGLQAASWLATVPYGAVKIAYALGGGIVGGLAWVWSGGNTEVAKAVWIPSMTGDYIMQPQNLTGEKPLHFVGGSSEKPQPELYTSR
jgi:hypothetical protein